VANDTPTIETKEIRGLNIKVMFTIIGAVISSTIAIIMTINNLRTDLMKLQNSQENNIQITDLKLRTLDIRVTNLEMDLKDARRSIDKNSKDLKNDKSGD
jgi:hypothetical protein